MSWVVQHSPLVLASGSAVRAQMLKAVGLQFSVVPSGVDETHLKQQMHSLPPADQAAFLAREKCLFVSKDYSDAVTIGADQICEIGGIILDKPHTPDNAKKQLLSLNAATHHQHSAVCVAKGNDVLWQYVATVSITLRHLTEGEIEAYIAQDEPLQSCGSYRLEGMARHLFAAVDGDHDVIKGLPLTRLLAYLHSATHLSLVAG